jgi:predicted DNA-binding transcriptional regulator AlpA
MIVNFKSEVARRKNIRHDRESLECLPSQSGQHRVAPSLPPSLPPRGLSRKETAAYIGVSPSLFDEMEKDGRMPKPLRVNSRVIWDRWEIDQAFEALKDQPQTHSWDDA